MKLLYTLLFISIVACSSGVYEPSVEALANANYGPKPPQHLITEFLLTYYRSSDEYDSKGVIIEGCGDATKAWWNEEEDGFELSNQFIYGWKVECRFNAKNDFGEYLGAVSETYYIKNRRVFKGYIPTPYKPVFR